MPDERWRRLDRLLGLAQALPADARRRFVEKECADDPKLAADLHDLLAASEIKDDFLEEPRPDSPKSLFGDPGFPPRPGEIVGSYRLTRLIGDGGSGVVYEAERVDGRLERRVAVKLLKHAFGDPEALARFRNEGLILARLDHPNIARIYDAGSTESGVPYLVMEVADGVRIDDFCLGRSLPTRHRLSLFAKVCNAVALAHRSRVVHRDLKPSNILVSGDGEPKLLDFGIAKLLTPTGDDPRSLTRTAFQPMTPQYASPEQLAGATVTPASDVYSLGMLLFRILTGGLPYRLGTDTPSAIERLRARRLRTPPPSRYLEATAATAEEKGAVDFRNLKGDLDRIVMRAMEPVAEDRYPTAEELSTEVRQYLDGARIPVHGRPLRALAGPFLRRNRVAVAVTLAIGFLVALVMIVKEPR